MKSEQNDNNQASVTPQQFTITNDILADAAENLSRKWPDLRPGLAGVLIEAAVNGDNEGAFIRMANPKTSLDSYSPRITQATNRRHDGRPTIG